LIYTKLKLLLCCPTTPVLSSDLVTINNTGVTEQYIKYLLRNANSLWNQLMGNHGHLVRNA